MRKRARNRQRLRDRHLPQQAGEFLEISSLIGIPRGRFARMSAGRAPGAFRQGPNLFDPVEQRVRLMLSEYLTEQITEQPDVVSQRLVRIADHDVTMKGTWKNGSPVRNIARAGWLLLIDELRQNRQHW
jgi:hypothetical protein